MSRDLSPRVREDEILATCMDRSEALARARATLGASGESFTIPGNAPIWEVVVALHDAGRPIELSLLVGGLEAAGALGKSGGVERLQWLLGSQSPRVTTERVASVCVDLQRYRHAIEVRNQAAELGRLRDAEVMANPSIVHARAQELREAAEASAATGLRHPKEFAMALSQQMLDRKRHGTPQPKTGIEPLDEILKIQRGAFYVIAGRPSEGKTSLGLQAAINFAASGHPCAFYSREMPGTALADRGAQIIGRLDGRRPDSKDITHTDAREWYTSLGQFSELHPLRLDETTRDLRLALAGARAWLRSDAAAFIQNSDEPDKLIPTVLLDYLQKFHIEGGWPSREREVAEMSLMIADFALDEKCAAIAMAQINRTSKKEKRRPIMEDLRESGAIEQDAKGIVLINQLTDMEADGPKPILVPAELIVAKNTFGEKGIITVGWRPRSTRFESYPPIEHDRGQYAEH